MPGGNFFSLALNAQRSAQLEESAKQNGVDIYPVGNIEIQNRGLFGENMWHGDQTLLMKLFEHDAAVVGLLWKPLAQKSRKLNRLLAQPCSNASRTFFKRSEKKDNKNTRGSWIELHLSALGLPAHAPLKPFPDLLCEPVKPAQTAQTSIWNLFPRVMGACSFRAAQIWDKMCPSSSIREFCLLAAKPIKYFCYKMKLPSSCVHSPHDAFYTASPGIIRGTLLV